MNSIVDDIGLSIPLSESETISVLREMDNLTWKSFKSCMCRSLIQDMHM